MHILPVLRVFSALSLGVVIVAPCMAADQPINALWNDTNGFGIWLYGRAGSCAEFDYKQPPYVVFGTGAKKREQFADGTYSVDLPNTCLAVTANDVPVCTKGSISAKYDASSNEFTGTYDFVLRDGQVWKGSFRAQRCK